ncbi:hypothetical protein FHR24_001930 [Wenyingzhuangia heitensis]|uniref:Uncharacterized protein n=1 Tax=Wenyingzhuangia heitensis TaxID=1487859 RepID=A0ABX0U9G8_9FLAO|nr:hypothetical protein [Wenyingzhuangia heitensis]NIJ45462.1 hypothetical protein [Wenyingzhuangia heitensis]
MKPIPENISVLILEIKNLIGMPVSVNAVMAVLESMGIREIDVKEDYHLESLAVLAALIFKELLKEEYSDEEMNPSSSEAEAYIKSNRGFNKYKDAIKFYIKGLMSVLPIFIQIACVVIFGYAIWVNVGFNDLQSTAVVLSVIWALILTGGFIQMIGRVGSYYWCSLQKVKAYIAMNRLFFKAIRFVLTILLFINVVNFFLHLYPYIMILIYSIYTILISILLLCLALMYPIEKRWTIIFTITTATAIGLFLKFYTNLHIYLTHWIGISTVILLSFLVYQWTFRDVKKNKKNEYKRFIRDGVIIYNNNLYFLYGTFLYILVFMDRFLAWSADRGTVIPYVIYYEKDYEIGMDLSIVIFFLVAGVLEYSMFVFSKQLNIVLQKLDFYSIAVFKKAFAYLYFRNLLSFLITSLVAFLFVYGFMHYDWGYKSAFGEGFPERSYNVLIYGSIGYFCLSWAMLNVLYMFRLNQPKNAVKIVGIAIIIDFVVGAFCSRFISYEYSVLGMLAGMLFFLLGSLYYNYKIFSRIDYYAVL